MKIKYSLLTLTLSGVLALTSACKKDAPAAAPAAAAPADPAAPAAGEAAAAPAVDAPIPKNEEGQKLIETLKGLIAERKAKEAMAVLQQVSVMPLSMDQQNELSGLRTKLRDIR